MTIESNREFLRIAREHARQNAAAGGPPEAALLAQGDAIVAIGRDRRQQTGNPIACAEMECIRLAGRRTDQATLTLYTTGYPNMLVAGTVLQFAIGALVIGRPEASTAPIDLLVSKGVPVTFCAAHE